MEQELTSNRDYASISPSARSLLLLKGLTDIPFARKAAELISKPQKYKPDFTIKDFAFWARVVHFEGRYKSIDQLLAGLPVKNILELSSGFSFRGLDMVIDNDVYYIDTDLPDVINTKLNLQQALEQDDLLPKGELETVALNALDQDTFTAITNRFPEGEIAVVNEGLLVYLDLNEKRKLCSNIRNVLKKRGGYWITGDVYVKAGKTFTNMTRNDKLQQFFKEHNIEENKFESFDAAEAFFKSEGFVIDLEAKPDYAAWSSLRYLLASASNRQLDDLDKAGRINALWRLRLADNA